MAMNQVRVQVTRGPRNNCVEEDGCNGEQMATVQHQLARVYKYLQRITIWKRKQTRLVRPPQGPHKPPWKLGHNMNTKCKMV